MAWILVALLGALLGGCDYYDKPRRPVPEQFEAQYLDGRVLDKSALAGHPWVVELWVPG